MKVKDLYNTDMKIGVVFTHDNSTFKVIKRASKKGKTNEIKSLFDICRKHHLNLWVCENLETHENVIIPIHVERRKNGDKTK